eukprot:scaffold38563_cov24-Attheya_sp.AAC.1
MVTNSTSIDGITTDETDTTYFEETQLATALKKQIKVTVEAAFISTLHHELTGFNQVTTLQMITHLYATYGDIDEIDIKDNKITMMKAYDPEKTLATLTSQLEEGRDFAHIGLQPISEN